MRIGSCHTTKCRGASFLKNGLSLTSWGNINLAILCCTVLGNCPGQRPKPEEAGHDTLGCGVRAPLSLAGTPADGLCPCWQHDKPAYPCRGTRYCRKARGLLVSPVVRPKNHPHAALGRWGQVGLWQWAKAAKAWHFSSHRSSGWVSVPEGKHL